MVQSSEGFRLSTGEKELRFKCFSMKLVMYIPIRFLCEIIIDAIKERKLSVYQWENKQSRFDDL